MAPENTGQVSIERQALVRMSFLTGVFLMEVPSARQIIAARGLLGISQQRLAEGSGVSIAALKRVEAKADQSDDKANIRVGTISKLMVYLNGRGIAFLSHDDFKGVVLKEK